MKIIYLPGKSLKNKDEGDVITSFLKQHGYDVYYHQWNHWDNSENELELDGELQRIYKGLGDVSGQDLVLIGKSLGSYVSMFLIDKFKSQVKKVILLGVPINDFVDKAKKYPETLKTINVPIYVIQNSDDPHGTPEQVEDLLSEVKYELIEKDGSDHRYYYTDEIFQALREEIPASDE